jgi:SAM-dependent methyltransferase
MHHDVADLRDFYAGPLGLVVRRLLAQRIRARWPEARGQTMIGLGFCTPYLGSYRNEAARIGALMPAAQGALVWPSLNGAPAPDEARTDARPTAPRSPHARDGILSVLVDEAHLPLPDNSVDRLLAVHVLEVADRVGPVLREMWRVLAPEGRLLMVVPNRRSIWARGDTTPFGQGRPYSRGQLERLLADALFEAVDWSHALYLPPIQMRFILKSALGLERLGSAISRGFGGVIIVEARKTVAGALPVTGRTARVGGFVTVQR